MDWRQAMTGSKRLWLKFLGGFALANIIMIGLFLGFVIVNRNHLPALRFSVNIALNEKVRWLQRRFADGHCDTLVIGSSMALNSVNYRELEAIGLKNVTNAGAWALGVPQTLRLLETILPRCKPTTIIYPVYFGDFEPADAGSDIDFAGIAAYLARPEAGGVLDYLAEADPYDLIHDYGKARGRLRQGRSVYQTLDFDAAGSVMLAADHFQIDVRRWEGYRFTSVRINDGSLRAFGDLVRLADTDGIRLVVAETPMRAPVVPVLGRDKVRAWQQAVAGICVRPQCRLVEMPPPGEFGDALFVDFAHLNENGARQWTRRLAAILAAD